MEDGTLINLYTVTRNDKPTDPNKRYFVLDLSTPDVRDYAALSAYAHACEVTGYTQLAGSLNAELAHARREGAARYTAGQKVRIIGWDEEATIDRIDAETGEIWATSAGPVNYSVAYAYVDLTPLDS